MGEILTRMAPSPQVVVVVRMASEVVGSCEVGRLEASL